LISTIAPIYPLVFLRHLYLHHVTLGQLKCSCTEELHDAEHIPHFTLWLVQVIQLSKQCIMSGFYRPLAPTARTHPVDQFAVDGLAVLVRNTSSLRELEGREALSVLLFSSATHYGSLWNYEQISSFSGSIDNMMLHRQQTPPNITLLLS
jgi:hypothetical protein